MATVEEGLRRELQDWGGDALDVKRLILFEDKCGKVRTYLIGDSGWN